MTLDSGLWGVEVCLDLNTEYLYKYVVDGTWTYDPTQPSVGDGYGDYNNVIEPMTSCP